MHRFSLDTKLKFLQQYSESVIGDTYKFFTAIESRAWVADDIAALIDMYFPAPMSQAVSNRGRSASTEFVYGEICPLSLWKAIQDDFQPGETFADLGSGSGKLVAFVAMALNPAASIGIESMSTRSHFLDEAIQHLPHQGMQRCVSIVANLMDPETALHLVSVTFAFMNNVRFGPDLNRHVAELVVNVASIRVVLTVDPICLCTRICPRFCRLFKKTGTRVLNTSWSRRPKAICVYERTILQC